MSTSKTALSARLVMATGEARSDELLRRATDMLHERFEIGHVTLQLESEPCGKALPTGHV